MQYVEEGPSRQGAFRTDASVIAAANLFDTRIRSPIKLEPSGGSLSQFFTYVDDFHYFLRCSLHAVVS